MKKLLFLVIFVFLVVMLYDTFVRPLFFDPPLPASEELACRVEFVAIEKTTDAADLDTCITVHVGYDVGSQILAVDPGEPMLFAADGRQFVSFPGGTGADGKIHFDIDHKTSQTTNAIIIEYRFSLASVLKEPGGAVFGTEVSVSSASDTANLPVTLVIGGLDHEGDLLPPGAVARLGSDRFELPETPAAAVYAPDGSAIFAAASTIHRFDAARGLSTDQIFLNDVRQISKLAVSPRGDFLAAATISGVRLVNLKTGKPCAMLRGDTVGDAMTFSPEGDLFATTTVNGGIHVWLTGSWRKYRSIPPADAFGKDEKEHIAAVEFSPSGKVLAVAGRRTVQLIDIDKATTLDIWTFTQSQPVCTFKPDTTIAFVYGDQTLVQKDYIAREEVRIPLKAAAPAVDCLQFLPDDRTLIGAAGDKAVMIDSETGSPGEIALPGKFLCVSPDGRTIVSAAASRLDLVEAATGKTRFTRHAGPIADFDFSYDGGSIVSTDGKFIYKWNVETGRCINRLIPPHPPRFARFLADTSGIAWYDEASLVNLRSGTEVPVPADYEDAGPRVNDLTRSAAAAVSSDGRLFAQKSSNMVTLTQTNGLTVHTLQTDGPATAMAFSSDSRFFAAANLSGGSIYNAAAQYSTPFKLPHIAGDLGGAVERLAFSPKNDILAVCDGMHVFLIEVKSGDIFFICETDVDVITAVRFSPDGNRLATDTHSGCLMVWDVTVARQLMATLAKRAGGSPYWLPISVPESFQPVIIGRNSKTRIRSHLIHEKVQRMW